MNAAWLFPKKWDTRIYLTHIDLGYRRFTADTYEMWEILQMRRAELGLDERPEEDCRCSAC